MSKKLVFLKTDQDFARFKQSKLYNSKSLKLRVRFNTNQNTPRFGFIISKKTMPKVTDRNKVKRRLKNAFQKLAGRIRGSDLLAFPQKNSLKAPYSDLEAELVTILKNANIWKS